MNLVLHVCVQFLKLYMGARVCASFSSCNMNSNCKSSSFLRNNVGIMQIHNKNEYLMSV